VVVIARIGSGSYSKRKRGQKESKVVPLFISTASLGAFGWLPLEKVPAAPSNSTQSYGYRMYHEGSLVWEEAHCTCGADRVSPKISTDVSEKSTD
jgi:hypothetical protein